MPRLEMTYKEIDMIVLIIDEEIEDLAVAGVSIIRIVDENDLDNIREEALRQIELDDEVDRDSRSEYCREDLDD